MANMKYFSDHNGSTVELATVWSISNEEFADRFPGVKGRRDDGFSMRVGSIAGDRSAALPVTRTIEYKAFPSKHICNAKCVYANGRIMRCECSCGGKNHGRGAFNCTN